MRYFPIFHDLRDRPVVVVGGGEDALRKIRLLLKTEARIHVIAPVLHGELAVEPRVNWIARDYRAELLDGASLIFSAESSLDERVAADARGAGIPVNVVDRPDLSTFIVPSIVDRDPLVVAIGTEGTAPILGQGLRAQIDGMLPPAIGQLAKAGAVLRGRVADAIPPGNRRRSFWYRFFFGDVRDAFLANDACRYHACVEGLFLDRINQPTGRVAFVGLPTEDPDLLTLRAQRKLQEADLIVHDRGVPASILELSRRDAVRHPVSGRLYDGTDLLLIREARNGKRVVRLTVAEPSLEETITVAAEGIAIETVPSPTKSRAAEGSVFPVDDDITTSLLKAAS